MRVGTPEPPRNYVLPPVLLELKRRAPRVDIRAVSGHTPSTLARLHAGELVTARQITELTLAFLLEEGVFPRVAVEIEHLEASKRLVLFACATSIDSRDGALL